MRSQKKPPIFFDLDETLIYATEPSEALAKLPFHNETVFDYTVYLRPEAHELLGRARAGRRDVYLFTHANFTYATEVSKVMQLGFNERTIFSFSMILNCRKGLCPEAVLIENKPPADEDTLVKMQALGITDDHVWMVPSFEPPNFPSAKLFTAGFDWRLAKLDRNH